MTKIYNILFAALLLTTVFWAFQSSPATAQAELPASVTLLDGSQYDTSKLKGKTVLFVNVASRCGFTNQYDGMQQLYDDFKDKGLVVIGVPCNQFGNQEPGTADQIQEFCKKNYGVSFPILDKQDVNGKNRSLIYQYLVNSEVGGGKDIRWNFEKFLVNGKGEVIKRYGSMTKPNSRKVREAVQQSLSEY